MFFLACCDYTITKGLVIYRRVFLKGFHWREGLWTLIFPIISKNKKNWEIFQTFSLHLFYPTEETLI